VNRVSLGLISDTHGLIRPEALEALRGCDLILHAGDVGTQEVLTALGEIARVVAVRGNNDRGAWAKELPQRRTLKLGEVRVHLLHALKDLDIDLEIAQVALVVSGHSHRPMIDRRDGVLFVNPGSAGPRRFRLPVSVARCEIVGGRVEASLVPLAIAERAHIPIRRISR
jgi:putative phosphoesterase